MILDRPLVELSIVIDGVKCSILLFDKEERCSIRALRRSYIPLG